MVDAQTTTTPAGSSHGRVITDSDAATLLEGIELAFDYRGDVTLVLRSGDAVEGYVYDRRTAATLEASTIRLLTRVDGRRLELSGADVQELRFSGRDTAEGKSFETWMRKYVEKKLAGESAGIDSEPLDD